MPFVVHRADVYFLLRSEPLHEEPVTLEGKKKTEGRALLKDGLK